MSHERRPLKDPSERRSTEVRYETCEHEPLSASEDAEVQYWIRSHRVDAMMGWAVVLAIIIAIFAHTRYQGELEFEEAKKVNLEKMKWMIYHG